MEACLCSRGTEIGSDLPNNLAIGREIERLSRRPVHTIPGLVVAEGCRRGFTRFPVSNRYTTGELYDHKRHLSHVPQLVFERGGWIPIIGGLARRCDPELSTQWYYPTNNPVLVGTLVRQSRYLCVGDHWCHHL